MEKQRAARLAAWRAGAWAGQFCVANALRLWRSRAQRKGNLEVCIRLAEGRRAARTASHGDHLGLVRRLFVALRDHAQTRKLGRLTLAAWSTQIQRTVQADKQVCTGR